MASYNIQGGFAKGEVSDLCMRFGSNPQEGPMRGPASQKLADVLTQLTVVYIEPYSGEPNGTAVYYDVSDDDYIERRVLRNVENAWRELHNGRFDRD